MRLSKDAKEWLIIIGYNAAIFFVGGLIYRNLNNSEISISIWICLIMAPMIFVKNEN